MFNKLVVSMLVGLLPGGVYSQHLNRPKLDSLFNQLAEKKQAMGSVVLSKNGAVLYSRTIGYSSISGDGKKPANQNTKYRIGSITKIFTAAMVLQLVEEGKTSLSTTLDAYFPQLPNAQKITIGNLLSHRSGLHNFTADPDYHSWMTQAKTEDEILAMIVKNGTDFNPNEKYAYSNTNYVLLGYIIEKICKQPYSTVLKERITSKIGLSNTYAGGKINVNNNECRSYKYVVNGWKPEPETDMSIPGGAGDIVSTPADLAKFIEALFSLKLCSMNSLTLMKTMNEGYGMGLIQAPFDKKIGYGHSGGIDGFASELFYFPNDGLALAYCSNGVLCPINDILIGILSIYYGRDYSIPTFATIVLKTGELDKYLGVYSSTEIPLKITISKENATLMAQATGQSAFPLEATDKDKFKFDPAGIKMDFDPGKHELTLKQRGGSFLFTRDK